MMSSNFSLSRACTLLGVDLNVDDSYAVKQKWRKRALEVHPDKVQQWSATEEQIKQATNLFHELQLAVEIVSNEVEKRETLAKNENTSIQNQELGNVDHTGNRTDIGGHGAKFNHFPISGERYPWAGKANQEDGIQNYPTRVSSSGIDSNGTTRFQQGVKYSYVREGGGQERPMSCKPPQGGLPLNDQRGFPTDGMTRNAMPSTSSRPQSGIISHQHQQVILCPSTGSNQQIAQTNQNNQITTSQNKQQNNQAKPERYFRSDGTEIKKSEYLDKHFFGNAFGSDQLNFREYIHVEDFHCPNVTDAICQGKGAFQMVWRCTECDPVDASVCCRLKPKKSLCICGHKLADHQNAGSDGTQQATLLLGKAITNSGGQKSLQDSQNLKDRDVNNPNNAPPTGCKKCPCKCFTYHVSQGAWEVRCDCKHKRGDHKVFVFNNSCHGILQQFRCGSYIPGSRNKPCPCRNFKANWVCNCGHGWGSHESVLTWVPLPDRKPLFGREWVSGGLRVECREMAEEARERWAEKAVENAMMNDHDSEGAKLKAVNYANRKNISEVAKARMQEGIDEMYNNQNVNTLPCPDRQMKVVLQNKAGIAFRSKPQMDMKVVVDPIHYVWEEVETDSEDQESENYSTDRDQTYYCEDIKDYYDEDISPMKRKRKKKKFTDGIARFGDIVSGQIYQTSGWFKCSENGWFLPLRTPDGSKMILEEIVIPKKSTAQSWWEKNETVVETGSPNVCTSSSVVAPSNTTSVTNNTTSVTTNMNQQVVDEMPVGKPVAKNRLEHNEKSSSNNNTSSSSTSTGVSSNETTRKISFASYFERNASKIEKLVDEDLVEKLVQGTNVTLPDAAALSNTGTNFTPVSCSSEPCSSQSMVDDQSLQRKKEIQRSFKEEQLQAMKRSSHDGNLRVQEEKFQLLKQKEEDKQRETRRKEEELKRQTHEQMKRLEEQQKKREAQRNAEQRNSERKQDELRKTQELREQEEQRRKWQEQQDRIRRHEEMKRREEEKRQQEEAQQIETERKEEERKRLQEEKLRLQEDEEIRLRAAKIRFLKEEDARMRREEEENRKQREGELERRRQQQLKLLKTRIDSNCSTSVDNNDSESASVMESNYTESHEADQRNQYQPQTSWPTRLPHYVPQAASQNMSQEGGFTEHNAQSSQQQHASESSSHPQPSNQPPAQQSERAPADRLQLLKKRTLQKKREAQQNQLQNQNAPQDVENYRANRDALNYYDSERSYQSRYINQESPMHCSGTDHAERKRPQISPEIVRTDSEPDLQRASAEEWRGYEELRHGGNGNYCTDGNLPRSEHFPQRNPTPNFPPGFGETRDSMGRPVVRRKLSISNTQSFSNATGVPNQGVNVIPNPNLPQSGMSSGSRGNSAKSSTPPMVVTPLVSQQAQQHTPILPLASTSACKGGYHINLDDPYIEDPITVANDYERFNRKYTDEELGINPKEIVRKGQYLTAERNGTVDRTSLCDKS